MHINNDERFLEMIAQDVPEILENSEYREYLIHILEAMPKNRLERLLSMGSDARRTRDYRSIVKKLRKKIYYDKRRFYHEDKHVSMVERGVTLHQLIGILEDLVKNEQLDVIADFGSGLFPTSLIEWRFPPKEYIAIDNNSMVIEELERFSRTKLLKVKLRIVKADISKEYPEEIIQSRGLPTPELSLFSRVLHTLKRAKRVNPVDVIEHTPSRIIVVSEARYSLVRGEDILEREKRFLDRLARKTLLMGFISHYYTVLTDTDVVMIMYR